MGYNDSYNDYNDYNDYDDNNIMYNIKTIIVPQLHIIYTYTTYNCVIIAKNYTRRSVNNVVIRYSYYKLKLYTTTLATSACALSSLCSSAELDNAFGSEIIVLPTSVWTCPLTKQKIWF